MSLPPAFRTLFAMAIMASGTAARASDDKASLKTVWNLERIYWEATVKQDDPAYQAFWHKDFLGWPCGEALPVTGSPPPMTPDAVKRSYTMDKQAATVAPGVIATFYHVREIDTHPDGRVETTDYNITHNWVPTRAGWKILSGMCKSPEQ